VKQSEFIKQFVQPSTALSMKDIDNLLLSISVKKNKRFDAREFDVFMEKLLNLYNQATTQSNNNSRGQEENRRR
jgi:hypothetical protein